jgi:shikimate dehydrogenase
LPDLNKYDYSYNLLSKCISCINGSGEDMNTDISCATYNYYNNDANGNSLDVPCIDYSERNTLIRNTLTGNTLIRQDDKWVLHSTDVLGFQQSWNASSSTRPKSVLIIGSGATARAAAAAFDHPNTSISVVHRNADREESMQSSVLQSKMGFLPWQFTNDFYESDLVINTTPKGVLDAFASELIAKPSGTFFDVIYYPWPTEFATSWLKTDSPVISGLDLLVAQGIEQIRLFSGLEFDADALSSILKEELSQ